MDFRSYVREYLSTLTLPREPEVVEELAEHLQDVYQDARASGVDHDAALARAQATLAGDPREIAHRIEAASRALPARLADRWQPDAAAPGAPSTATLSDVPSSRRGRLAGLIADLRADTAYAVRMLARAPGFTFVVALILALGIGANAVIFSAVDALLLRQAPLARPDRLVSVYTPSSDGRTRFSSGSYPDYVDLRDSGALADLAAYAGIGLAVDVNGATEQMPGEVVSGNYFDTLGVRFAAGRGFLPDEDRLSAPVRVVVLSYPLWQTRFGGDPSLVGRTLRLNGQPYTVVGVTARGFTGPELGRAADLYVPMAMQKEVRPPSAGLRRSRGGSADLLSIRSTRWMNMIGRLRDDTTIDTASAALNVRSGQLAAAYPDSNRGRATTVVPLGEGPGVRASSRPLLRLLIGAVIVVLLIASANVAGLLLTRAVSRRREVAVRVALGASRGRLARQWLTEAVLLSLIGAIGGLLIARWGAPLLHEFGIPESVELGLNPRVLAFTLVVGMASGLLFGLAPVFQLTRRDTLSALRDEGGAVATGVRAGRLRGAFVVLQIALTLVLLVGAGLFLRTLHNAYAVDLGYRVDRVLLAEVNLDVRNYTEATGQVFYAQLLDRLRAVPGIQGVSAARVAVLGGGARSLGVSVDGRPVQRDNSNALGVRANVITDGYLETMGVPLLRGRSFARTDSPTSPKVAIVSRSLAARVWGDADPIGKRLIAGGDNTSGLDVIGVVPDVVYASAVERDPPPFFLIPLAQNYESGMTLHLRTAGDPMLVLPAVREALRDIDHQLAFARPRTLAAQLDRSFGDQRMMATLVGVFGVVAFTLAAVGLYGVMAHLVGRRTMEMGLRLALGARPSAIVALIVRDGLRLVAIGVALGLAGAYAGARLLETHLFGIRPTDPTTFITAAALFAVVSVAACVIPARRAMRVDPAQVLRGT